MIQFRRDKEGNLYSVRNGEVIGRIESIGDGQEEAENGKSYISRDDEPRRRSKG